MGALKLANWICRNAPKGPDPLGPFKLQKLAFYCYGGLLAYDVEEAVGSVMFQAWKNGPTCRVLYECFKRDLLPDVDVEVYFPEDVQDILLDVLNVYGRLSSWQIREESTLERCWEEARQRGSSISTESMRRHFREKFRGSVVQFPEKLFGTSNLALSHIALPTFTSLKDMSVGTSKILGPVT